VDIAGFGRHEESDDSGHVGGGGEPTGGDGVEGAVDHVLGRHVDLGRLDRAGHHGVAGDTGGGELEGDASGQADHACLCRRVVRLAVAAVDGGDAAEVDDAAPAALDHVGKHGATHLEGAGDVDVEVAVPRVRRDAVGPGHVAIDAGHVHKDVDAAESPDDVADFAIHGDRVGDV